MTERFSGVAGCNFTKQEVNAVVITLQNKFVLDFPKIFCFCTKAADLRVRIKKKYRLSLCDQTQRRSGAYINRKRYILHGGKTIKKIGGFKGRIKQNATW